MATTKKTTSSKKAPSSTQEYKIGFQRGYEQGYREALQGIPPKYNTDKVKHRTVR